MDAIPTDVAVTEDAVLQVRISNWVSTDVDTSRSSSSEDIVGLNTHFQVNF
jgi:hypothetical protein